MKLERHEQVLIQGYRRIGRKRRQIIWHVLKAGLSQQELRLFFD